MNPFDSLSLSPAVSLSLLALGAVVFTLAGFVKGVIGMGLPTIAMGLLSVAMPPAQAAALLVVPSLVTNVWQIAGPGWWALMRRLATLLVGVCLGIAAGAGWLTGQGGGSARITAALGVALVAYALLGLLKVRLQVNPRHEPWLSPIVGLATGLVTAASGVFVIPAVPYLNALGLGKEELVRALGISFLVSTIALAVSLRSGGALELGNALGSLLALLPALAGMALGQWVRLRVQPELFKRIFFSGLLALGSYLVLRSML
ncbi:MAG: sulfite exporter TauE/SafE family protein [Rhizobacter sp.]|nr:sulfite exporter TauE/SafE family protein [Rhizobacter sp.]